MVTFVCEGCNESLKKNKVQTHSMKCRNCIGVTCIDCSVTFTIEDHVGHTGCITEAEKYQGALFQGKSEKKKNSNDMSIDEKWKAVLLKLTSCPPCEPRFLWTQLGAYDNVPRKKAKFINFLKNSVKMKDMKRIELVWNRLQEDMEPVIEVSVPTKQVEQKTKSMDPELSSLGWKRWIRKALKSAPGRHLDTRTLKKQILLQLTNTYPKGEWPRSDRKKMFTSQLEKNNTTKWTITDDIITLV